MVNLAKLKHFHSKLKRDLISGAVEDPAALRKNILVPIMSELEKIRTGQKELQLLDRLTPEESREFFATISNRKSKAPEVTEDYVLKVLKAWNGPVDDPAQWVSDNIFAFYPIDKFALRKSFCELQENMQRLMIKKGEKNLVNTDIHKVLAWFRSNLSEVREKEWNEERLRPVAKMLGDSIQFYDNKKEELMNKSPGWKFLRWALLNGRAGLSLVPTMVLLGREETIHRLRTARRLAVREEEKQRKLRKKAAAEEDIRKVRVRYMGETFGKEAKQGTAARSLLERTIERRNVKIHVPKERGENEKWVPPPRSLASRLTEWRSMRDTPPLDVAKGPFVSRPPEPTPQESIKRKPTDVERSPQFLAIESWKTGHRRLDLDGKQEEKNKEYAPAFWELRARPQSQAHRQYLEDHGLGGEGKGEAHWASPAVTSRRAEHLEAAPARPPADKKGPFLLGQPIEAAAPASDPDSPPADKKGPFLLGQPIEDYQAHVRHLRELNTGIAKRRERLELADRQFKALKAFTTGPMYAGKALGGTPKNVAVRDEKGFMLAGREIDRLMRFGEAQLPHEVSAPDLMESVARNARAIELERRVRKGVIEEDRTSVREAERKLASYWAKRN